jgi:hypothetical protein
MRNTAFFLVLAAGLAIACTSSAGAMPTNVAAVKEAAMAAGAYEMLPRIRNRSLQLSLVSTVTQRPIAADARFDFVA